VQTKLTVTGLRERVVSRPRTLPRTLRKTAPLLQIFPARFVCGLTGHQPQLFDPLRQLYQTTKPAKKALYAKRAAGRNPCAFPGIVGVPGPAPLPRKHRFFGDGARRPVFSASKNTGLSCGNRCRFARKTGRVVVNQNPPWWGGKFRGMLRPPGFAVGQMGPVPVDPSG
jgi:hypothetical protein